MANLDVVRQKAARDRDPWRRSTAPDRVGAMSSALDAIVDQIADAVARRVVEMQRAAAAKKRTLYLTPPQLAERTGVTVKTLANLR